MCITGRSGGAHSTAAAGGARINMIEVQDEKLQTPRNQNTIRSNRGAQVEHIGTHTTRATVTRRKQYRSDVRRPRG